MQNRTPFILIFFASFIIGCGSDDTAVSEQEQTTPAVSGQAQTSPQTLRAAAAVAKQSAPQPSNEAGPAFCGLSRPPIIKAAFEFKLPLGGVKLATETECQYELNVPGAQVALLIYRVEPIAMWDLYKDSSQKTADIPNLGEEAILLGNVHVEVKLDDERALEVSLKVVDLNGDSFPMTAEKSAEGLIRLAKLLSVIL